MLVMQNTGYNADFLSNGFKLRNKLCRKWK